MKRLLLMLLPIAAMLAGCKYDDSEVWKELDSQNERIAALESTVSTMNSNLGSLQSIVTALQKNITVTAVKTTDEGEQLTAVQLYADEHPVEFRVMLGTIYALTDGFTKMGKILTKSVNKKVNSSLKELERRLDAPSHQGGSFNFIEGGNEQRPRNKFQGLRIDLP